MYNLILLAIWAVTTWSDDILHWLRPGAPMSGNEAAANEEVRVDEVQRSSNYPQCHSKVVRLVRKDRARKLKELLSANPDVLDCRTTFEARSSKGQVEGSLLHLAADKGKAGIVRVLLDYGSDPNQLTTWSGGQWPTDSTALMFAACLRVSKARRVTDVLLEAAGIDANLQNQDGMTALMLASQENNVEVVSALSRVEDLSTVLRNKDDMPAVMLAAALGHQRVIHVLVGVLRANINLARKDGENALSLALKNGHGEAVLEILKCPGLRINQQAKDAGNDLLEAAFSQHRHDAVASLLARGVGERFEEERLQRLREKTGRNLTLVHTGFRETPWEMAAALAETSTECQTAMDAFRALQAKVDSAWMIELLDRAKLVVLSALIVGTMVWEMLLNRITSLKSKGWSILSGVPICLLYFDFAAREGDTSEEGALYEASLAGPIWHNSTTVIRTCSLGCLLVAFGILVTYAGDHCIRVSRPKRCMAERPEAETLADETDRRSTFFNVPDVVKVCIGLVSVLAVVTVLTDLVAIGLQETFRELQQVQQDNQQCS